MLLSSVGSCSSGLVGKTLHLLGFHFPQLSKGKSMLPLAQSDSPGPWVLTRVSGDEIKLFRGLGVGAGREEEAGGRVTDENEAGRAGTLGVGTGAGEAASRRTEEPLCGLEPGPEGSALHLPPLGSRRPDNSPEGRPPPLAAGFSVNPAPARPHDPGGSS